MNNELIRGFRVHAVASMLLLTVTGSHANADYVHACEVPGYSKAALIELSVGGFSIEKPGSRNEFALRLVNCLGDPDPEIRDSIAFTGLATLLRGSLLSPETIQALRERLSIMVAAEDSSADGFRRPFAVLALSEVGRADRIEPIFTDTERAELVTLATQYMRSVTDYRGFSDAEGWRHGVAHGADLLLQLALNSNVPDDALAPIVDAALSQVAPASGHFYVFGESARLARPVLLAAQRGVIDDAAWAERFAELATPSSGAWAANFSSEKGLAELHNTRAFLLTVYASIAETTEPQFVGLRTAARDALQSLP